jgi:predicted nuclease of restriction endonuclease-like RecB superfamily
LLRDVDLPLRLIESRAFLDLLGPQDEPWLRVLIAEMVRFEGRRAAELSERLAEPLACIAPHFKRRAATRALWRLWRRERKAAVVPARARAELFGARATADLGANGGEDLRRWLLDETAARLDVTAPALAESLFADMPGERLVRAPDPVPTAMEAALRTNLAIAQAVLMRASRVELRVEGAVRPIVRLAKFRGLLCTVLDEGPSAPDPPAAIAGPWLHISGPFALFRHTLVYGRALAELLPHLAWCARFELRAACALRGRIADVTMASGDPIFPALAPPAFDSRLEERFARDFGRLAPHWDLVREPEAVRAGKTLIFPDFQLCHRLQPQRRVLVEIVGFWTPEYLTSKLARLREARLDRFILCIDADRGCAQDDLPAGISVLRYRRRVDAAAVLREAERLASQSGGSTAW